MDRLINFIKKPSKIALALGREKLLNWMPDPVYLKLVFKAEMGKDLDFNNPQTFNEKLQWLKVYNRKPEYCQMVDKFQVREYIKEKVGEEYLIPLIGVWEKAEDIDFESLPNQFVLKCNHDSHSVIICKDKSNFDKNSAISKLSKCLLDNPYYRYREWPYKDVRPLIIAEKYMEDKTGELRDYKFHCFNGEPKFILVCGNRFGEGGIKEDFYTPDWELINVKRPNIEHSGIEQKKPETLEKMREFAKILSKDLPFIRVDFYDINDKVYFGELTFFPASGFRQFEPKEWDYKFGSWLTLPEKNEND